jgi:hypothetical protein
VHKPFGMNAHLFGLAVHKEGGVQLVTIHCPGPNLRNKVVKKTCIFTKSLIWQ